MNFNPFNPCTVCKIHVARFDTEKMVIDGQTYHKACHKAEEKKYMPPHQTPLVIN